MASYITTQNLLDTLAATQGSQSSAALPPHWVAIAPIALASSYYSLRAILISRGFTSANIDAWEANASYQLRVAICHAYRLASQQGKDYDLEAIKTMCAVETELQKLEILTDVPEDGTPIPAERVGFGPRTASDFTRPHLGRAIATNYGGTYPGPVPQNFGQQGGCNDCGFGNPLDDMVL